MKPLDVLVPVEVGEKTYFNRIGTVFEGPKALTVLFDAVPVGGKAVVISEKLAAMENRTYQVSTPVEYTKNGKTHSKWVLVGVALVNKKGLSLLLSAFPVNGKAVVGLVPAAKEPEAGEEPAGPPI